MGLVIAAVRTGSDPVGRLPEAAFHTTLEEQLLCPKCDAAYNVICDYEASVGRHFARESHRLLLMMRKAIMLGHGNGHRVSHFETAGVVVRSFEVEAREVGAQGGAGGSPDARGRDRGRPNG